MPDPVVRTIPTSIHGRFLLRTPLAPSRERHLLVGFHGYGENADRHLEALASIPGSDAWLIVAVQALHRFYKWKSDEVVASWMTRQDRELAIADNIAYVNRIVGDLAANSQPARLVFVGFSQGVAMAFRAALAGAWPCDGVIALGGDVPPELKGETQRAFPLTLLGRGARDSWYTEEKLDADLKFLHSVKAAVHPFVFDGGHEWTEAFREAAGEFLRSLA
jgi:predicted esterase